MTVRSRPRFTYAVHIQLPVVWGQYGEFSPALYRLQLTFLDSPISGKKTSLLSSTGVTFKLCHSSKEDSARFFLVSSCSDELNTFHLNWSTGRNPEMNILTNSNSRDWHEP